MLYSLTDYHNDLRRGYQIVAAGHSSHPVLTRQRVLVSLLQDYQNLVNGTEVPVISFLDLLYDQHLRTTADVVADLEADACLCGPSADYLNRINQIYYWLNRYHLSEAILTPRNRFNISQRSTLGVIKKALQDVRKLCLNRTRLQI